MLIYNVRVEEWPQEWPQECYDWLLKPAHPRLTFNNVLKGYEK
jgi:hypothetical protein